MGQAAGDSLRVRRRVLPYASSLQRRDPKAIDLVVIHCTELPDLATAREYGERVVYAGSGTGNSGHYYVERNGGVEEWVPPDRVAHHSRGFNDRSIGVELVNNGRYPDWFDSGHQKMTEPYPRPQVTSLIDLLKKLQVDLPALRWIAGHESLDTGVVAASDAPEIMVRRKRDPGPMFPWDAVLASVSLALFKAPPG
jgi:N-acetylmuramoyl-L-alanine amidase